MAQPPSTYLHLYLSPFKHHDNNQDYLADRLTEVTKSHPDVTYPLEP